MMTDSHYDLSWSTYKVENGKYSFTVESESHSDSFFEIIELNIYFKDLKLQTDKLIGFHIDQTDIYYESRNKRYYGSY